MEAAVLVLGENTRKKKFNTRTRSIRNGVGTRTLMVSSASRGLTSFRAELSRTQFKIRVLFCSLLDTILVHLATAVFYVPILIFEE